MGIYVEVAVPPSGVATQALCVARANGEFHVLAVRQIEPGTALLRIEGDIVACPSRHSVQLSWDEHIEKEDPDLEMLLDRYAWRFLNHSCDGNSMVRGREVVAIRRIQAGEEITFNYNTTEYDISAPFPCRCGSLFCAGEIRGFKHLERDSRLRLRHMLSPYLRALLDKEEAPVRRAARR